ncbi:MAG: Hsp20/alpha crystallin family protein [Bacteroidia bacterium]|nr:Hsp20/alpha crystallin family protein [Bacteroidia bacterium]
MNIIKQPKMITDIFQSNLDNMLQEILIGQPISDRESKTANINISENEDTYQINVVMPGIEKENISLSLDNNTLIIHGKINADKSENQQRLRTEFLLKNYQRKLNLPKDAEHKSISANLKNGILEITINKKVKVKPKNIIVK